MSDDGFDDDEVQRAIALSLNQSSVASGSQTQVPDDNEYEDEELLYEQQLQKAMELSRVDTPPATSNNSFLSDRARLEQERLQRQSKRMRTDDGPGTSSGPSRISEPTAKRPNVTSSSSSVPPTATIREELFWDGEYRPVANEFGNPRKDRKPTFRLTEVLGKKDEIAFAILSSYALDFAWIYQFFDSSVPVIMVTQPDSSGNASIKNVLPNWIKVTPFLPNGLGTMHMKFMLLFYKTGRLRIVVSTANLVPYDWRQIENFVWLQDFLPSTQSANSENDPEAFPSVLQRVLNAVNVKPALETMVKQDKCVLPIQSIEDLTRKWDWSRVKVYLVPSVAGKHEGWDKVLHTGHTRLMKVVRNMGLKVGEFKVLSLEYQGSSIGTYSSQWINEFYWSARGQNSTGWLDKPKRRREQLPYPAIKILYPTKKTVKESRAGEQGGGTMFCRRAQWSRANFPRQLFHDSKSRGGDALMHTKMILATITDRPRRLNNADADDSTDEGVSNTAIGWVYIGSHNFTPSAWGNLSGSGFTPVMNIRNYELGIVFPLHSQQELDRVVVWERPAPPYEANEPWIQEESVYFSSDSQ